MTMGAIRTLGHPGVIALTWVKPGPAELCQAAEEEGAGVSDGTCRVLGSIPLQPAVMVPTLRPPSRAGAWAADARSPHRVPGGSRDWRAACRRRSRRCAGRG